MATWNALSLDFIHLFLYCSLSSLRKGAILVSSWVRSAFVSAPGSRGAHFNLRWERLILICPAVLIAILARSRFIPGLTLVWSAFSVRWWWQGSRIVQEGTVFSVNFIVKYLYVSLCMFIRCHSYVCVCRRPSARVLSVHRICSDSLSDISLILIFYFI